MFKPRPYQHEANSSIKQEWESATSTVLVLPTGCGKTCVFATIIKDRLPRRSLVIAHREELVWQARSKIEAIAGVDCGIEMADFYVNSTLFGEQQVVISTVQTLNSKWGDRHRMGRFKPTDFDTLIIDECFPAGTPVDGRPIESIKVGDKVRTHNGYGRVTRLFKKPVTSMCVVTFSNRETLVCTPNHPIWTQSGFKCAMHLTNKDMVVSIIDYELLPHLQDRSDSWKNSLWEKGMQVLMEQGHHPENIQPEWGRDNAIQKDKRDEQSRSEGESCNQVAGNGLEADSQKRKRAWSYDPRACSGVGAWVAMQCDSENSDGQTQWLSELLQVGCGKFRFADWGGGGRILSLLSEAKEAGQKESGVLEFQRVESVKVYESSDRDAVEWLCPDGFVYNIEVSNGHTYFAGGVLVHNCHHSTAGSYRRVIDYYKQNPNLRVLGVTATPDRHDEEALGQVFDTVAFDYEVLDAIHDGWLVPIAQQFVSIGGLDFSHVRTTAGDLNGADLANLMESEKNMQGVTGASIDIIGNKRALLFTASVAQAEQASDIFNRHRQGSCDWVCGETPKDKRRQILEKFKSGDTQIVCNCGVLTEGFDDPGVEVILMGRPTKSRSLYAQMAGRGTRPLDEIAHKLNDVEQAEQRREMINTSPKPMCLIVDFVGNSGRHKLCSSADILGGKVSDEIVERAIAKAKKDGGAVRMDELMDEEERLLQEKIEKARMADRERKAKIVAKVRYNSKEINPFDLFDIQPVKQRGWDNGKTLSEKQCSLLLKNGIDPDKLNYTQGRQVISEMFRRWDNKLCTAKQASLLKRFGYETKQMKMEEASKLITSIRSNNWQRPAKAPSVAQESTPPDGDERSPF